MPVVLSLMSTAFDGLVVVIVVVQVVIAAPSIHLGFLKDNLRDDIAVAAQVIEQLDLHMACQ